MVVIFVSSPDLPDKELISAWNVVLLIVIRACIRVFWETESFYNILDSAPAHERCACDLHTGRYVSVYISIIWDLFRQASSLVFFRLPFTHHFTLPVHFKKNLFVKHTLSYFWKVHYKVLIPILFVISIE